MKLLVSLAMQLALLLMAFSANAEPPKAVQLLESANLHEVTHLYPSLPPTTRIFQKEPTKIIQATSDEQPVYQVRVKLQYDSEKYQPERIEVFNQHYHNAFDLDNEAYCDITLPKDSYDISCNFWNLETSSNSSIPPSSIVIIENVVVGEDTEITVDASTATNLIEFISYNPDGELSSLPWGGAEDNENNPSSIGIVFYETSILSKSKGSPSGLVVSGTFSDYSQYPSDRLSNVLINDLSEDYYVTQSRIMSPISEEPTLLQINLITHKIESCVISNHPVDYILLNREDIESKFIHTPYYGCLDTENYYNWETGSFIINEINPVGINILWKNLPKIYFDIPFDATEGIRNMMTTIMCIENDHLDIEDDTEGVKGIATPFIIQRNGQFEFSLEPFVSSRAEYQASIECYWDGKFNPYLNSTFPLNEVRFGNSTPWAFFTTQEVDWSEWTGITERELHGPYLNYIGQYGEVREIDNTTVAIDVYYNSNKIKSFNKADMLKQWSFEWLMSGEEPGELKYVITNENIEVEGLKGKNYIEAVLDERNEECTIPTLQYLGFEDSDGKYTNSFKTGKINLFAGDFFLALRENAQLSPKPSDYSVFSPLQSMKVEYASYGTDDFTELNMDMIPGAVWHPFGQYYSAEIDGLSDGWYDVRVTMEDEAGNWQKQTISPAFKILDSSSVGITPYDTETTPTYYNLQGVRIDKPENGIFIERTGNSVRKVVK